MSATESRDGGHDGEETTIIVNGRKVALTAEKLSFDEVVRLAFPNPPTGQNIVFTVTYSKGEGNKAGTLVAGQTIKIKDDMIFNVTPTDKS